MAELKRDVQNIKQNQEEDKSKSFGLNHFLDEITRRITQIYISVAEWLLHPAKTKAAWVQILALTLSAPNSFKGWCVPVCLCDWDT